MTYPFQIGKREMALGFTAARVVHSNKYNGYSGFYLFHLFFQPVFQDIVFHNDKTGDNLQVTLRNYPVPLFSGQEVQLISVDDRVIGYLDPQTREYHYLTRNLPHVLDVGLSFSSFLALLIGVLLLLAYLVTEYRQISFMYFLLIVPLFHWCYLRLFHLYVERIIDKQIQQALA